MLMIRFQRIGRTNDSAFRIAVLEKERAAQAGNIVELLGTYNPRSKALTLNEESVKSWLAKGAQPTDSIKNLLITKGVISGKKVNVLPKSLLEKKPEVVEAPAAAPVAAAPAAAEEVAAPTEAEVEAEAIPAETPVAEAAEEVPTAETPAA
jgi:small subunit ribosomal protein S16